MVSKMGEMSGVITYLEMGSNWVYRQGEETTGGSRCEADCRGT